MDNELKLGADKFLAAAREYYALMVKKRLAGGTIYLTSESGECVIFTRGEYLDKLLRNIRTELDTKRQYSFGVVID